MYELQIEGGTTLSGEIDIQGSKNAVLPILAATILTKEECVIRGCPDITDVTSSIKILNTLGAKVEKEGNTLIIDASVIKCCEIPEDLMREMRSSIFFLGAIVGRCGSATISAPGGCELGQRPIDIHLKALKEIGVEILETGGSLQCSTDGIKPCGIHLNIPSVGATENIMLASCLSQGTTTIHNAAKEPEIVDLQNFLNIMGARIRGAGGDTIEIEGVNLLHGAEYKVMPDRIAAATYLFAGLITGGDCRINNINSHYMLPILSALKDAGAEIYIGRQTIDLIAPKRLHPTRHLQTYYHPGFPTDAQPFLSAAMTIADGTSRIIENIFENRFRFCSELTRMGADIFVRGGTATIAGVPYLTGAKVHSADLRGGAALVIAGLAARGITTVCDTHFIDRGYENFATNLANLGANIKIHKP